MCALLASVALLAGCQQQAPGSGSEAGSEQPAGSATSRAPADYGAQFLGVDECSSRGREVFHEVSCTSEKAHARVISRFDGTQADGPACPVRTDFVLHISESSPSFDEDGDGSVPQGYACMRNLESPHPGDPGGGGGPRTVVGDCVYSADRGEVRETACDGSGERDAEYKVTDAVGSRRDCPKSTGLYVQLGGRSPVGCAEPV